MGQMEGGEEEFSLELDELETIEEVSEQSACDTRAQPVFASSQEEDEFMRWLTEPDETVATTTTNPVEDTVVEVATTTTNPVEDIVELEDVKRVSLRLHGFHCTAYPDYVRDHLFIGDGQRFLDLLGLTDVEGKRTLRFRGLFWIDVSRCLDDEDQWVMVEDVEWEMVQVLGLPPADAAAPDIPAGALADAAPEVPAPEAESEAESEVPAASSPAKPNRNKMPSEPAAPEDDAPEADVPAASSSPPASPPKPNRNKMVLEPAAPTMVAIDDDDTLLEV
eukprot:s37_g53.t1